MEKKLQARRKVMTNHRKVPLIPFDQLIRCDVATYNKLGRQSGAHAGAVDVHFTIEGPGSSLMGKAPLGMLTIAMISVMLHKSLQQIFTYFSGNLPELKSVVEFKTWGGRLRGGCRLESIDVERVRGPWPPKVTERWTPVEPDARPWQKMWEGIWSHYMYDLNGDTRARRPHHMIHTMIRKRLAWSRQ